MLPLREKSDKRLITWTFAVSLDGKFSLIQLIYQRKSRHCLPKFNFLDSLSINFTKNHWLNIDKSIEFFKEIIYPYLKMRKEGKGYHKEQHSLIIMDTYKGEGNDTLEELCFGNN